MLPLMITLVLGGIRSGKSDVAEALVQRSARPATYIATGRATDADMAARIAAHRERRERSRWATVEVDDPDDLADLLGRLDGPVLVDSLGTWVASFPDLDPDVERLCAALRSRESPTVLVSEEVGLGVHAATEVGRRFADRLGTVNRTVAEVADQVLLVVAGRVLPLPEGSPW
ncbi:MAG: bifunctional adenosylcobinamide kinase/adenosylcobinamide-phosphate guanylyltransferase [Acidimicrobiales bacterium]